MLGANYDDALAKAVEVATPWYVNMANTGHNKYVDPEGLVKSIPGVLATHWVLGNAEECAAQLRAIGEQLIPLLKDFESVTALP